MMRRVLLAALATAAIGLASTPASAAVLVFNGVTYSLMLDSISNSGLTGNYTLSITGINGASDTEKGRTGINGFAFNDAKTAVSGVSSGYTFQLGGLDANGCNGSGNGWFCFKNTGAAYGPPMPSSLSIDFSVTSNTAGAWDNWAPSFKIDWTGTKDGGYNLVSTDIPVNTPPPVPEPATWALMLLGFGGIGFAMRRSRNQSGALMQVA